MDSFTLFGTRIITGEAFALPTPDSDNLDLLDRLPVYSR